MPVAANSMDCAIATEVFEHCPDPAIIMREIARVLSLALAVLHGAIPVAPS